MKIQLLIISFSILFLLFPFSIKAERQKLVSDVSGKYEVSWTCQPCHVMQFNEWSLSTHSKKQIECYECHGVMHSGSFKGCKRCHESIHNHRLENWPQVSRFGKDDKTGFSCMVCHDSHNGSLRKSLVGCYTCHGNILHGYFSDMTHLKVASAITPVHMDEFARERDGIVPWIMSIKPGQAAVITLFIVIAIYVVCYLVFFPLGYVFYSLVNFFKKKLS